MKNKCEKENHFLWGDVFLYKDIHFGNVSIVIKKNKVNSVLCMMTGNFLRFGNLICIHNIITINME